MCVKDTRELGLYPGHDPDTRSSALRLVRLRSFSLSSWVGVGLSVSPRCSSSLLSQSSPRRPCPRSRRLSLPIAPTSTSRVPNPLAWGSSLPASAAHEVLTTSSMSLFPTSVANVFSSPMSADAIGRSGSRSRRDGRFSRTEAATTCPRTKAWQPM